MSLRLATVKLTEEDLDILTEALKDRLTLQAEAERARRPMSREQFARHVGRSIDFVKRRLRDGMPRIQHCRRGAVLIPVDEAMQWLRRGPETTSTANGR